MEVTGRRRPVRGASHGRRRRREVRDVSRGDGRRRRAGLMAMIHYPLEVDGIVTRVLQAGNGDESVVLLHGGLSTANRWRASLEPLAEAGWRALAVDLPGRGFAIQTHGRSLTVPAFAEFVAGFLDEMELAR